MTPRQHDRPKPIGIITIRADGLTDSFPATLPSPQRTFPSPTIRVPLMRTEGLTDRTTERMLTEHERGAFVSLADFHARVKPLPEELEAMIRAGGFDEFGETHTQQFWEAQRLSKSQLQSPKSKVGRDNLEFDFDAGTNPVAKFFMEIQPYSANRRGGRGWKRRQHCLDTP